MSKTYCFQIFQWFKIFAMVNKEVIGHLFKDNKLIIENKITKINQISDLVP